MECSGVGLHSGAPVSMRILPAASGTGIVFRRTDLDGFEIEAISRNVARVSYATSLMKKGVLISTTEHVLSAFIGMGIDNAIVELDNLELPILDGSARPFVEMIQKAGIRKQRPAAQVFEDSPRGRDARGKQVHRGVSLGHLFRFLFDQFPASAHRQRNLSGGTDQRKLSAPHRRRRAHLVRAQDEQAMRNMGLIRGASQRELHRAHPRRRWRTARSASPTNSCATKCLDLVGDLALLGKQILGNVVADRAGHAMHTALVSRILRDKTLWEEVTFPGEDRASVRTSAEAAAGSSL